LNSGRQRKKEHIDYGKKGESMLHVLKECDRIRQEEEK